LADRPGVLPVGIGDLDPPQLALDLAESLLVLLHSLLDRDLDLTHRVRELLVELAQVDLLGVSFVVLDHDAGRLALLRFRRLALGPALGAFRRMHPDTARRGGRRAGEGGDGRLVYRT